MSRACIATRCVSTGANSFDEVNQRVRFVVSGELACRPLDIPIEFVAEVDVGSGKVQLTRLPAST